MMNAYVNTPFRTRIAAFAVVSFSLVLLNATPSVGTLIVIPGDHQVLPDESGQQIEIRLAHTAGDTLQGMNLNIQLDDGIAPGPEITNVDVVGPGTLFEADNNGQAGSAATPEIWTGVGTLASGAISLGAAEVTLAILTIDTSGFNSGSFPLRVLGTLNGDSSLLGASGTVEFEDSVGLGNGIGQVTIVPEPSAAALALLAFGALVTMTWRRGRK